MKVLLSNWRLMLQLFGCTMPKTKRGVSHTRVHTCWLKNYSFLLRYLDAPNTEQCTYRNERNTFEIKHYWKQQALLPGILLQSLPFSPMAHRAVPALQWTDTEQKLKILQLLIKQYQIWWKQIVWWCIWNHFRGFVKSTNKARVDYRWYRGVSPFLL